MPRYEARSAKSEIRRSHSRSAAGSAVVGGLGAAPASAAPIQTREMTTRAASRATASSGTRLATTTSRKSPAAETANESQHASSMGASVWNAVVNRTQAASRAPTPMSRRASGVCDSSEDDVNSPYP
eukprot:Amastigsp_a676688_24.p3 type:complete len:127 gc:universal Amastigsp_a676688_24:703-1083(+)